jgi:hypothetical protein
MARSNGIGPTKGFLMKMIAVALLAALGLSGCIAVPVYEPGYRSYGYYGGGGYYRPYGGYHRYRDRYP